MKDMLYNKRQKRIINQFSEDSRSLKLPDFQTTGTRWRLSLSALRAGRLYSNCHAILKLRILEDVPMTLRQSLNYFWCVKSLLHRFLEREILCLV